MSSDSASAKSNGALLTSSKNVIVITPIKPKYKKINQKFSWKSINVEKLKDSVIITIFSISNPKKISKLSTSKTVLTDANIAYLLRLKKPVNTIQKLNIIDNNDAYTVLYSKSNKLIFGPHTEFIQNE